MRARAAIIAWRDNGVERVTTSCRACLPQHIAEAIDHADGDQPSRAPARRRAA